MIGDDVAGALAEFRAQAESMMQDTCRITSPGAGDGPWDQASGKFQPAPPVVVYEGRCRIRSSDPSGSSSSATAAEETRDVTELLLFLPMSGSEGVGRTDQTVEYLTSLDSALVGRKFGVRSVVLGTQRTSRRVRLKEAG